MLQCLQFWWFVVRKGRGGRLDPATGLPHTTVSAQQASDWLLEKLSIKLDMKACQRALRSLVKKGVVTRQQERKRWGNHSYTYAPATEVVSNQEDTKVQPRDLEGPSTRTQVSNQAVLSSSSTTVPTALAPDGENRQERTSSKSEQPAAPASPVGKGKPLGFGHSALQSPPVLSRGRSVWEKVKSLASALDLTAIEPVSPSKVVVGGKVFVVDDGPCAPLR